MSISPLIVLALRAKALPAALAIGGSLSLGIGYDLNRRHTRDRLQEVESLLAQVRSGDGPDLKILHARAMARFPRGVPPLSFRRWADSFRNADDQNLFCSDGSMPNRREVLDWNLAYSRDLRLNGQALKTVSVRDGGGARKKPGTAAKNGR